MKIFKHQQYAQIYVDLPVQCFIRNISVLTVCPRDAVNLTHDFLALSIVVVQIGSRIFVLL